MGLSPARTESSVKGLAFISVMRVLSELRGADAAERVLLHMTPEVVSAFRYRELIATGWYPVAWYSEMWKGIRVSTGEGLGIVRAIGRESLRQDLKLVHKFALALLTPETVISVGGRLTAKYYRPTHVAFDVQPGLASAHYSDCAGWDENMWTEITAGIELILELAGAKHIRIRLVEGGRDKDDFAIFEGHWV